MKIEISKIVGTSNFRLRTAEVFDDVESGATYLITRGSKPVAIIMPVPSDMGGSHGATTLPSGEAWQNEPSTAPAAPASESWQTTNPAVTNDPIEIE